MPDPVADFFSQGNPQQSASGDPVANFFLDSSGVEKQASDEARQRFQASGGAPASVGGSLDNAWQNVRAGVTGASEAALRFATQTGASLLTGAPGQPHNADEKARRALVMEDLTYKPRTAEGEAASSAFDTGLGLLAIPGQKATELTGLPEAGEAVNTALGAIPLLKTARAPVALAPEWSAARQSMGAAAATSPESQLAMFSGSSPELKAAAAKYIQEGKQIDPVAAERQIEADRLGIRLSEGQTTQNPVTISNEMNDRAKAGGKFANFLKEQNDTLKTRLTEARDEVGPDVFSTDRVQHGDTMIQAYKDMDAPKVADINAKYEALNKAAGGQFPVDGVAFANNAKALLKSKLKTNFVPSGISADLERFAAGEPMSFEDFEAMRTNLASEMRDNLSGNARAASGLVRQALEELPLKDGAENLKPLADTARAAAKERFDAIEADPAYKAVVEDKVAPDDFLRKFVINGKRDDVAQMRTNLAENPQALQTMGVAAVEHLADRAGISGGAGSTFAQSGYNRAYRDLSPKLQYLVDPKTAAKLETIGNVANYTQFQPKGAYVNNSGSWVAATRDLAAGAVHGWLNVKTGGLYGAGKQVLEAPLAARRVEKATAPGAGMGSLRDYLPGESPKQ